MIQNRVYWFIHVLQGHKLIVFDVNELAVSNLTEIGADKASSLADVVKDVEVVVSMLPSNQHVLDVYNIKNGLLR